MLVTVLDDFLDEMAACGLDFWLVKNIVSVFDRTQDKVHRRRFRLKNATIIWSI